MQTIPHPRYIKGVKPLGHSWTRSRCPLFVGFSSPSLPGSPSGSWTCHWCHVSSLGLAVVCRVMLSPGVWPVWISMVPNLFDGMVRIGENSGEIHENHAIMTLYIYIFILISGFTAWWSVAIDGNWPGFTNCSFSAYFHWFPIMDCSDCQILVAIAAVQVLQLFRRRFVRGLVATSQLVRSMSWSIKWGNILKMEKHEKLMILYE